MPPQAPHPTHSFPRRGLWFCVGGSVFLLLLVWWGAAGVRGTDQYWYVADVESLINGRGVQTNQIFPAVLESDESLPRPFVHNIIPVFLAVLPGAVFGAYAGWIITNVVAALLTAFLIYKTASSFVDLKYAATAAFAYLWLPLTFWQITQPLAEATIALLVALTVYLYVVAGTSTGRWLVLLLLSGLLFFSRHVFLPLLALVPVAYWFRTGSGGKWRWQGALGLAGLAVVMWGLQAVLFPQYHSFSYIEFINGTAPSGSRGYNMLFESPPHTLDVSTLLIKAAEAVRIQFASADAAGLIFLWPFNLLALVPFVLARTSSRGFRHPLVVAGLVLLALHVLTLVLYQNQFRYSLLATPPLMVGLAVTGGEYGWLDSKRNVWCAVIAFPILVLPIDVRLAHQSRTEGIEQRQVRSTVAATIERWIRPATPVMVDFDQRRPLMIGYVLRPRPVLYLVPTFTARRVHSRNARVGANWLIAPITSSLPVTLDLELVEAIDGQHQSTLGLYRFSN